MPVVSLLRWEEGPTHGFFRIVPTRCVMLDVSGASDAAILALHANVRGGGVRVPIGRRSMAYGAVALARGPSYAIKVETRKHGAC